MTNAEHQEKLTLTAIQHKLQNAIDQLKSRLSDYHDDIQQQKNYLWNNRDEMDHIEKIAARQSIEQAVFSGDKALELSQKLSKLINRPYFGRFDFTGLRQTEAEKIYIGVYDFYDENQQKTLIYDWRAPIASMFYDYELGKANYQSPQGKIAGEISLKRQFRIIDGELHWVIDTAVNIMDDVLQQELSRTSDEGMKNIVATIQRDQNAVIRNEHAQTLIIQGVAGSGKTSIALHRIAFLLYRFKNTLKSTDILILSPNKVFSDYISNVLPELGEEKVNQIEIETLADELLDNEFRFQTFAEQLAVLLEKEDVAQQKRIQHKASADFLTTLDKYVSHVENNTFVGEDLWFSGRLVPGFLLEELFQKHRGFALTERVNRTVKSVEQRVGLEYNYTLMPEERTELKKSLRKMYRRPTLRQTYKALFDWLGEPDLFKLAKGGKLEFCDVFPLIFLKMRLEGKSTAPWQTKHLLIDEMQDYSAVQYAVIAKLFSCKKTILGDASQSVNPYSGSSAETIRTAFLQASLVKLNKSYRSTLQITEFAQQILPNPEIEPIARHGDKPQCIVCKNAAEHRRVIIQHINAFQNSEHHSLGIICKTQKQAEKLADILEKSGQSVNLLTALSTAFSIGVVVCSAHLAKGLEFDRVLVVDVSADNYHSDMHRQLLYVACTRAMHQLDLTYVKTPSVLLPVQRNR